MALQHLRSSTADKRPTPGSMSDGQLAINTNVASAGVFFKDSSGALVKVGPVHVGATAPNATPASGGQAGNSIGEQWLDTTGGTYVLKVWDGSNWRSEAGTFVDVNGDTMTGALVMDNQQQVRFRETTANGTNYIAIQAPASVSADRTLTLPDVTGTLVSTGDTGTVTSTMIVDGTIVNGDINASAAIAGTKISPDFGSQTVTTTGVVSAAAGAAGTPSIAFTGDLNTGLYSPGSDQVAIATGGTGRLFVDASGNVSVGASSSDGLLHANGGAIISTRAAAFGTTILRRAEGSIASPAAISASVELGRVSYRGYDGASYQQVATIGGFSDGAVTSASAPGYLEFYTTPSGSVGPVPRLRITSAGLVGIGTSNPQGALHVFSGTNNDPSIARFTGGQLTRGLTIGTYGTTVNDGGVSYSAGAHKFLLGGTTEAAQIDASGRLLIGTSSSTANALLTVAGYPGVSTGVGVLQIKRGSNATATDTDLGTIWFGDGLGDARAAITASSDAAGGAGDLPSRLVFSTTADGAPSPTERMRITNDGQVSLRAGTNDNGMLGWNAAADNFTPGGGNITPQYGIARGSAGTNTLGISGFSGISFYTGSTSRMTIASGGSVAVAGALSKGSGSFRIDHPLAEKKDTHQLVHSFIEGPQADLIYRGHVCLENGKAEINIDQAARMTEGTFEALCRDVCCFTTNETDWTPVRGSVAGNILTIEAQDPTSTADICWMVIGERKDQHMYDTDWTDENGKVITEPIKEVAALESA